MLVDGNGLTSLGSRAYLMNVLPHALAKAFCVLNHGYYASAYYPEIPLDWIAKSLRVICLTTMINGNAFCQGTAHDVTRRVMECPAMQFFGYLKTTNQIKMTISKRYKTRSLKNPLQKLFIEGKPKNYFLALVDDLGDFMPFPCSEDEYVQIRETLADAVHPSLNAELSETIIPELGRRE